MDKTIILRHSLLCCHVSQSPSLFLILTNAISLLEIVESKKRVNRPPTRCSANSYLLITYSQINCQVTPYLSVTQATFRKFITGSGPIMTVPSVERLPKTASNSDSSSQFT